MPLLKQSKIFLFGGLDWFRVQGERKAALGLISPLSMSGWQEDRDSQMMEDDMPVLIQQKRNSSGRKKGGEDESKTAVQITV